MTTQAVTLQLLLNGVFTDVPLLADQGATVTRGLDPGAEWPNPSTIECTINNDSLNYDPSLPAASTYGIAGRNTQAKLRVNGTTRLLGEAAQWEPDRTVEHVSGTGKGLASVKFTAAGVLRRLGLWQEPLRSPMYRTNSRRASSIGHWALEEDSDAKQLANTSSVLPNQPGTFKGGVTLGDSESAAGAASSVKMTAVGQLAGRFGNASTTAGWQVFLSFKLPAVPAVAGTYTTFFRWTAGNGYTWTMGVDSVSYKFEALDASGTSLWSSFLLFAGGGFGGPPTTWTTMKLTASVAAGTVTVDSNWYVQGDTSSVGMSSTFAGSVSAPKNWFVDGSAAVDGAWFSHIGGVTGIADALVGATAQKVFNGYNKETAGARFTRLCAENGIQAFAISYVSSALDGQPMGPQRPDTFIALLKEIRDTDDCRIDDERFNVALTLTTRRALYGQAPALTLAYPSQVMPPFKKVIGDRYSHNRVTVKNRDGGEETAELLTGDMSILAPPAGIGEAKGTVDVNVASEPDQLDNLAAWHLAKGTLTRPRYDSVSVDLLANPGLEAAATAVREGNVVRVTGYEPDPIDLLVVGIVDQINDSPRSITFKTEPYEPYQVNVWDDVTFRYDSRTATVNTAQTTTTTVWSVKATDANDTWSTAVPYDWMVAGERVTVTAMSAVTVNSPVSYTQTATVTRSVNGVIKAQAVGNEIHIADPDRWGF